MPRKQGAVRPTDDVFQRTIGSAALAAYSFEQSRDCPGLTAESKLGVCQPASMLWLGLMRRHGYDWRVFDFADEILKPSNLRDVINRYEKPSTLVINGVNRSVICHDAAMNRLMRRYDLRYTQSFCLFGVVPMQRGRFTVPMDYVEAAFHVLLRAGSKRIDMRVAAGGEGHSIAMHSIGIPNGPVLGHILFDPNFGILYFTSNEALAGWWMREFKGEGRAYTRWKHIEIFELA